MSSFDINTAEDFLEKLLAEHRDFKNDLLSARHAINACMTAYHLHEWVWGERIAKNYDLQGILKLATLANGKPEKKHFFLFLSKQCPDLKIAEAVTNGSKHFDQRKQRTGKDNAAFGDKFGVVFDTPYLWIERESGEIQTAEDLLNNLVGFWEGFFKRYLRDTQSD